MHTKNRRWSGEYPDRDSEPRFKWGTSKQLTLWDRLKPEYKEDLESKKELVPYLFQSIKDSLSSEDSIGNIKWNTFMDIKILTDKNVDTPFDMFEFRPSDDTEPPF
jgi:hypothetical protein